MYPYEREDYFRFAFVGDEWLIEYAHQGANVVSAPAKVFSMAMTFELYLKAYYSKIKANPPATKFGHKTDQIIIKIQEFDLNFPSELNFKMSLLAYPIYELDREKWQCPWYLNLNQEDRLELKDNYEFYVTMAYGADLKYGISPSLEKHNGRIISSAWTSFNPRLSSIVIAIRNLIVFPGKKTDDLLMFAMRNPKIEYDSKKFLEVIMQGTKYSE